jgi:hypothetical protein
MDFEFRDDLSLAVVVDNKVLLLKPTDRPPVRVENANRHQFNSGSSIILEFLVFARAA